MKLTVCFPFQLDQGESIGILKSYPEDKEPKHMARIVTVKEDSHTTCSKKVNFA